MKIICFYPPHCWSKERMQQFIRSGSSCFMLTFSLVLFFSMFTTSLTRVLSISGSLKEKKTKQQNMETTNMASCFPNKDNKAQTAFNKNWFSLGMSWIGSIGFKVSYKGFGPIYTTLHLLLIEDGMESPRAEPTGPTSKDFHDADR